MPETGPAIAAAVAERLRLAVANLPFIIRAGGGSLHITVSIGVTTAIAGSEDRDRLLKRADDALYRAKAEGRDRVVAPASEIVGRPGSLTTQTHEQILL